MKKIIFLLIGFCFCKIAFATDPNDANSIDSLKLQIAQLKVVISKQEKQIKQLEKENKRLKSLCRQAGIDIKETTPEIARKKPKLSLSQNELQVITTDEKRMEDLMNLSGYKSYCNTLLNEEGTIDIVMTSGSFKDSASSEAVDNYIGAAVATVGKFTSKAKWKSRKLIIKVDFGKQHEISTLDCRKVVELWNRQLYRQASDFMFANLKEVKK